MNTLRVVVVTAIAMSSVSCGIRPYKAAGTNGGAAWVSPGYFLEGYRDVQIGDGVYIVEYLVSGGYTDPIPTSMEYAMRRAGELCPNGFTQTFAEIGMEDARIEEFRCTARGCLGHPMVSGIVTCNKP